MDNSGLKDARVLLPGVLTVNKKKYAVNLLWDEVPDDRKYRAIIKNRLKLVGCDLFTLSNYLTGRQYAIADRNSGHRKNQMALASCIDNDGASLCALCEYDHIWILLAIDRNGCVIIDRASYNKDEMLEEFYIACTQYEWDDIVCPSGLSVQGSSERELPSLINRRGAKLYSAGSDRFYPLIFVGGCASVLLACIFIAYNHYEDKQNQDIQAVSVEPSKSQTFDTPWGGYSLPVSFIRACVNDMTTRYIESASIPGWKVAPVVRCQDSEGSSKMILSAKKDFGLNIWLEDGRYKEFFKGIKPKVDNTDNLLNIEWSLDVERFKKGILHLDDVGKVSDKRKYLRDNFEYYFINTLQMESAITTSTGVMSVKFRFSLKQEPTLVLPILTKVSDLIIDNIVFNYDSGLWDVEGRFWGK